MDAIFGLGPEGRVDEHIAYAHDEPVAVEHGEQPHEPDDEVEVRVRLACQYVADGGVVIVYQPPL